MNNANPLSFEELQEIYESELKRKDEIIERLREDNERLLKTALAAAQSKLEEEE